MSLAEKVYFCNVMLINSFSLFIVSGIFTIKHNNLLVPIVAKFENVKRRG